jgi:hypothetical protein
VGRDGMSNNDGAPLSISALTSLCEQSTLFYATAVTSSPLISRGRLRSSFWLPPLDTMSHVPADGSPPRR